MNGEKHILPQGNPVIVEPTIPKELLNNFVFTVEKFEVDSVTTPSYYKIGFNILCDPTKSLRKLINRSKYKVFVETTINYKECEGKTDYDICLAAYNKLKGDIKSHLENFKKEGSMVGTEFIPPEIFEP